MTPLHNQELVAVPFPVKAIADNPRWKYSLAIGTDPTWVNKKQIYKAEAKIGLGIRKYSIKYSIQYIFIYKNMNGDMKKKKRKTSKCWSRQSTSAFGTPTHHGALLCNHSEL